MKKKFTEMYLVSKDDYNKIKFKTENDKQKKDKDCENCQKTSVMVNCGTGQLPPYNFITGATGGGGATVNNSQQNVIPPNVINSSPVCNVSPKIMKTVKSSSENNSESIKPDSVNSFKSPLDNNSEIISNTDENLSSILPETTDSTGVTESENNESNFSSLDSLNTLNMRLKNLKKELFQNTQSDSGENESNPMRLDSVNTLNMRLRNLGKGLFEQESPYNSTALEEEEWLNSKINELRNSSLIRENENEEKLLRERLNNLREKSSAQRNLFNDTDDSIIKLEEQKWLDDQLFNMARESFINKRNEKEEKVLRERLNNLREKDSVLSESEKISLLNKKRKQMNDLINQLKEKNVKTEHFSRSEPLRKIPTSINIEKKFDFPRENEDFSKIIREILNTSEKYKKSKEKVKVKTSENKRAPALAYTREKREYRDRSPLRNNHGSKTTHKKENRGKSPLRGKATKRRFAPNDSDDNDEERKKIKKNEEKITLNTNVNKRLQKNRELADDIMQADPKNPYAILKISKDVNLGEARKAYRDIIKRLHPDKNDSKNAHEAFIRAQKAFADITRILYYQDLFDNRKNTPQKGFGIKKWVKL